MKRLIIIFFLITTSAFGQLTNEGKYNWDYVIKRVKESKSTTAGTKRIISEISTQFDSKTEQIELIEFYKNAYDYKIVDKAILKNLIDSLAQYGLNEEIKVWASEARVSIEYRLLNKKIKDFSFPDKNGNQISLTSLNDKIVIIELWATWCGPCIKEMPKIPGLRELNSNIEFYSISLDKTSDKMKRFVEKNKYEWPIVFGGDEESNKTLWEYFNVVAIPKYYTVDREGTIINVADKLDEQFIKSLK
ncbi:MAG: TlpA family protein disulfide reductase [Bacteroidetes bacterium]|nr:TlpA family protein disulfide reductase [Bacteroidota bacterium]